MLCEWDDVLLKLIAYSTIKLFRTRIMIDIWVARHKSFICGKRGQICKKNFTRSGSEVLEFFLYDENHVFLHIAFFDGIRIQFNKFIVLFFEDLGGEKKKSRLCEFFVDVVSVLRL